MTTRASLNVIRGAYGCNYICDIKRRQTIRSVTDVSSYTIEVLR